MSPDAFAKLKICQKIRFAPTGLLAGFGGHFVAEDEKGWGGKGMEEKG